MSLLSRKDLHVLLGAEEITLQLISTTLFRPKVVNQQQVQFNASTDSNFLNATKSLDHLLSNLQIPSKTNLKISLASECVRYLTLPPQHTFTKKAESDAYAHAFYYEVYGEKVSDWEIRQDDAPPHLPTISAATNKQCIANLKALADQHKLKLTTVEPYLMTAVNYLSKALSQFSGYLAIVENRRLLLVHLHHGHLVNVKSDAVQQQWQTSLHQMLMRETLLSNEIIDTKENKSTKNASSQLLLYAPNIKNCAVQKIADWKVKVIGQQNVAHLESTFPMLEALV